MCTNHIWDRGGGGDRRVPKSTEETTRSFSLGDFSGFCSADFVWPLNKKMHDRPKSAFFVSSAIPSYGSSVVFIPFLKNNDCLEFPNLPGRVVREPPLQKCPYDFLQTIKEMVLYTGFRTNIIPNSWNLSRIRSASSSPMYIYFKCKKLFSQCFYLN
jgi:hypothetical protein